MGHTKVRCKAPVADEGNDGFGDSGGGADGFGSYGNNDPGRNGHENNTFDEGGASSGTAWETTESSFEPTTASAGGW